MNVTAAVERVDFQIDRNSQIAAMLGDEDRSVSLRDGLQHIDHPDLAALVGSVTEVGKASIPNQAADMLAWHTRRAERGDLDRWGSRRYWRMIEGGSGSRFGMKHMLSRDLLRSLGERFSAYGLPADARAATGRVHQGLHQAQASRNWAHLRRVTRPESAPMGIGSIT